MSYQVPGGPVVTFDTLEWERQVALFCQSQGITNDAQFQSTVSGVTAGSAGELLIVKTLAKCTKLVP